MEITNHRANSTASMEKLPPVQIVDSPCGFGKTHYACTMMNNSRSKFIFVTPYLDEITRVKKACKRKNFVSPEATGKMTKQDSLRQLLTEKRNIICTHALFELLTPDLASLIKLGNYTLVLDEVLNCLEDIPVSKKGSKFLFTKGALKLADPDPSLPEGVRQILPGDLDEDDLWDDVRLTNGYSYNRDSSVKALRSYAERDRLYKVKDNLLVWVFPSQLLKSFESIFCLTYLFEASHLRIYFEVHGFNCTKKSVVKDNFGRNKLVDFDPQQDANFRQKVKGLLNIIQDDRMNTLGADEYALSLTKWTSNAQRSLTMTMKKQLVKFFKMIGTPGTIDKDEVMWTCYIKNRKALKGNMYKDGFIAHNQRSTNDYANRHHLAYLINRFARGGIITYCKAFGLDFDDKLWAASEAIQWVFRSALRRGKRVSLFMPSSRMRNLMIDYTDNNLEATIEVQPIS